jgi:DNA polymerase-3 subunit delta
MANYLKLMQEIKEEKIRPLYLFYGEETYLLNHALKAIEQVLGTDAAGQIDKQDEDYANKIDRIPFNDLAFSLMTPAFIASKRLIILRRTALFDKTLSDDMLDNLIHLLDATNPYAVLIFVEDKIDKRRKKNLQAVQEKGLLVEFSKEKSDSLKRWGAAFLGREGIKITGDALDSLISRCDNDMLLLRSELEKIALAFKGQNTVVNLELLNQIALPDIQGTIFNLTDNIAAKNAQNALMLYQNLIEQRQSPQYILFMVGRHFRQLAVALNCRNVEDVKTKLNVVDFVARKLWQQKRTFSKEQVEAIYLLVADTDYKIKSGQIPEAMGMELLLLQALEPSQVTRSV